MVSVQSVNKYLIFYAIRMFIGTLNTDSKTFALNKFKQFPGHSGYPTGAEVKSRSVL